MWNNRPRTNWKIKMIGSSDFHKLYLIVVTIVSFTTIILSFDKINISANSDHPSFNSIGQKHEEQFQNPNVKYSRIDIDALSPHESIANGWSKIFSQTTHPTAPYPIIETQSVSAGWDLDQDGYQEFLVLTDHTNPNGSGPEYLTGGSLYLYEANGMGGFNLAWSWFDTTLGDNNASFPVHCVGDLDGDGNKEIILGIPFAEGTPVDGSDPNRLFIFEGPNLPSTPTATWNFEVSVGSDTRPSCIAVDDIDGDGQDEVAIGFRRFSDAVIDRAMMIFSLNGSFAGDFTQWTTEFMDTTSDVAALYSVTISDVDNDGNKEAFFASEYGMFFESIGENQYEPWDANQLYNNSIDLWSIQGAASYDIDSNGAEELVIAPITGDILIIGDVTELASMDSSDIHYIDNIPGGTRGLGLGDFDNDGLGEIFIGNNFNSSLWEIEYIGGDVLDSNSYSIPEMIFQQDTSGIIRLYSVAFGGADNNADTNPDLNGNEFSNIVLGFRGGNDETEYVVVLEQSDTINATWHVTTWGDTTGTGTSDNPFSSIQHGIDVAIDGDTVLVYQGTYYENINFNGKNIVVASNYINSGDWSEVEQTVIDGNQVTTVVCIENGENENAVLDGFTIRNGYQEGRGGGVKCRNSNPILQNLIIENNHALLGSGGLNLYNSSASLINLEIRNNSSDVNGGGLSVYISQGTILENVSVHDNFAPEGGGIRIRQSSAEIYNSSITNNYAGNIGGGLLLLEFSDLSVLDSQINGNIADSLGGGIYIDSSNVNLFGGSFAANSATSGGGISLINSTLTVNESVFDGNYAVLSGGGLYGIESNLFIDQSEFYNNTAENGYGGVANLSNLDSTATYYSSVTNSVFEYNMAYNCAGLNFWTLQTDMSSLDINIINCQFRSNSANRNTAILINGLNSSFLIDSCEFNSNEADDYAAGINMYGKPTGTIAKSLFQNNHVNNTGVENDGGAISIYSDANIDVVNCTVVNNSAGIGGGLTCGGNSITRLVNTIIWNNHPNQINLSPWNEVAGEIDIDYCDIQDGVDSISTDPEFIINWGAGNIDLDPYFIDPANQNYSLSSVSPCIDAGHPNLDGDGNTWENDPDDQDPDGTRMDMGAFYTEHLEEGSPYFGTGFSRIRVLDSDPINPDANQEAYVITGDQITVEVWVYPIGLPIHDEGCDLVLRPFWEGEVRGSYGLHFNWDEGGNLVYAFSLAENQDDVSGVGDITGPSVEVGTWTHLAGTYNGSSMKLFVNGNLVSEEPYSGIIGEGETGFYIGGFHVQNDEFLHGIIREVRLWDVPRSQGEIQASMYIQLNGEEPGLRGYWPLDQFTEENGIFPVTHDLTPNSNHLNVQGNIFLVDVDIGNEPLIEPWGHGFNGYAVVGEPFFYGSVIDGWPLTWSLVSGPEGFTVDPVTGHIEWTPTANQIGHQSAIIEGWNELGTAQGELWIFIDEFPVDWSEHANNNILFDVFNNGVLGSIEGGYDYWEDVGNGFHFNGENGLWEGDLIIGLSEDQVSGFIANREFATRSLLTNIQSPYAGFDQAFQAEFDDSRAPDPIGLHVIQRSYSKPTEPDNDYVIIDYELVNMSGNDLNGIYVGLAMDWDVGDYLINAGGYDPERNLSYIYEDQQGSREKPLRDDLLVKGLLMRNVTQNTNFYGVSALGGIVTGHVITINDFYNSDSLLFRSMTNFEIQEGVGDARAYLSVGPFDIPAGGSTQAMFAILGGEDLADLQANADAARAVGMGQFVSSISLSLTPDNHFNLTPMDTINLNFSAPIQPVSISSFININSKVYGDFPVDINLVNDNNIILIKPVYSFPLADTISGILKQGLTDTLGYLIDYDGDGVIGDFPIEYYTLLPADYNLDNTVDFNDLVIFRDTWWNKNQIDITPFELHPFQGQLPNVVIIPDNIYAYDELMTFVYMWNWSHQHDPPVMLASGVSFGNQPIIEQNGSNLVIRLPELTEAGQIVIEYQGITTDINCATEDGSTDKIILKDKDVESSQLLVEYAYISKSSTKSITLDTKALTRDNSTVTVFYTLYSDNKEIVSQGSQEIELVAVPEQFALHQNYPNPFNPVTTIEYDLLEGDLVKIAIIDILGRQVVQLTNEHQSAGYKSVRWNGRNAMGKTVSTGVYFYLLESGKYSAIRKLVILK